MSIIDFMDVNQGNFAHRFHSFLQAVGRAFCSISPISKGSNGGINPGKLLNVIEHVVNKARL